MTDIGDKVVEELKPSAVRDRRLGQVVVGDYFLNDDAAMRAVMSEIIVLKADHVLHEARTHYVAASPRFDSVDAGEIVPIYDVLITVNRDDAGAVVGHGVEFKKQST